MRIGRANTGGAGRAGAGHRPGQPELPLARQVPDRQVPGPAAPPKGILLVPHLNVTHAHKIDDRPAQKVGGTQIIDNPRDLRKTRNQLVRGLRCRPSLAVISGWLQVPLS
jgi:hypothetical protein